MRPVLCRVGLHNWQFRRPTYFGSGALEICQRCGKGRILHFAGAYEYFDAQGMETRQGGDGTAPSLRDDSPVAAGHAPQGDRHD